MKKMMKKLIAMAAALVMIVTLLPAVGAKATTTKSSTIDYSATGSLRIEKTDNEKVGLNGVEFTLYKIADLTQNNGYSYVSGFTAPTGYETPDKLLNLEDEQTAAAAAFADAVRDVKLMGTTKVTNTVDGVKGVAEFDGLSLGYYLVVENKAEGGYITGNPFFVAIPTANNADTSSDTEATQGATHWVYDVVAKPKNSSQPPIEKTDDSNSATTGVGETINFTINTTIPTYGADYDDVTFNVYDIMSTGLALVTGVDGQPVDPVVTVVGGSTINKDKNTTYDITYKNNGVGNDRDKTFEIVFADSYIKTHGGQQITITYSAVVTKEAAYEIENSAGVNYNTNPGETTDGTPAKVTKHTFGIDLSKYGVDTTGDTKRDLVDGAEFTLTDANGNDIKFAYKEGSAVSATESDGTETVTMEADNGKLLITGLKPGTYILTEKKAPTGYTLLANPVTIVIAADETTGELQSASVNGVNLTTEELEAINDGIIPVNIENNKGFTLPSTGGMGTYLFTIGGIVIMAGAAFALIAMKKRA